MATFTNTATLSYNGVVTSSNTTVGEILEQLAITKTAVSPVYSVDNDVTYAISLVNSGTTDLTGITLTDNLGSYTLDALTVTPLRYRDGSVRFYVNGVLQAAPVVTVGANDIAIAGVNVPAGGNALILYEAQANEFASPQVGGTIVNTVTATGGGITGDLTASETVTSASAPRLTINKGMSPTVVSENGRLTYTLTLQNLGNVGVTVADDAVVSDTFDPVLKDITVTFNDAVWTEGVNYNYDETSGEFSTIEGQLIVPGATYTQDTTTGKWTAVPGTATIVISGTV